MQPDLPSLSDEVVFSEAALRNDVAKRLVARTAEIEARFETLVKETLAAAQGQDFPTLLDHLPELIRVIVFHLENWDALPLESGAERTASRHHGRQRASISSYTIEQILAEYRLFRKVLFEVLERDALPIPPHERDTILDLIQLAAKHAASQFMHVRVAKTRLVRWAPRNGLLKCAVGLGLVAIATGIQWLFREQLRDAPYTIYYSMVIVASFVSYGLVVSLLSAFAAQYFFLEPLFSLRMNWPSDYLRMGFFIFNGVLISVIIGKLRKLESAAAESSNEQESAKLEVESVNQKLKTEQALRDQFVNTLSHDLRSPLTTIKISAQMLARAPERPDGKEKLNRRILEGADRIDHMIQDLLDVSRIRAGESLPLTKDYCELNPLIDDLIDELRLVHGNRFTFEGEENIEGIWSCTGVRRIIENLAANAVKYGASEGLVKIRLYRTGNFVKISVHNELAGAALSRDQIDSLFKPFRRTKEAEVSGKKGWGLGLTLVKGLAEAHGGSVQVESSETEGTTFIISIPR